MAAVNFVALQRRRDEERREATRQSDTPRQEPEPHIRADLDPWTELAELLLRMLEEAPAEVPDRPTGGVACEQPEALESPTQAPGPEPAPPEQEPEPPAATGPEIALLRGEVPPEPAEAVEMPDFPEGDTPLLEAEQPSIPTLGGAPAPAAPSVAEGVAGEAEEGGGSHQAIVARWMGQVRRAAAGIPATRVEVPAEGRSALRQAADASRRRNRTAREGLVEDALNTVPPKPELDTTPPPPPPPNPVPEHTQAVLDASGKTLPNQAAPALERSEIRDVEGQNIGGSLPPLGVEPVPPDLFQVLIVPGGRALGELPGPVEPGQEETREQRRVREALEKLTETGEATERTGRGEQVISPDLGPLQARPISTENRAHVGEIVTRLMSNMSETATGILDQLRRQAYGDEILMRTFPEIGANMRSGLETALSGEIRQIAEAANISGEELDTMVTERRAQLAESQEEAAGTVEREGENASATVREEGQETSDAIAGAAAAAEEETINRQAATAGEADPSVINARRDRIVAWFREHVTTQITNYQRAGDRRQSELTRARDDQLSGYRTLTQREVYQVMTPAGERPARDTSNTTRERALADIVAAMRAWRDERVRAVTEHFRVALSGASTKTREYRTAIETAGSSGIEAARRWAEDKILENESWWDRLVARVRRWLSEARDVNERWRVRRGRENRDAITNDIDAIILAHNLVRQGADLNALLASNRLTDAQKDAITAYFRQPPGMHPLDFAERRLRDNLARDHQPGANEIFERELIATPVSDGDFATANKLNDVGRQQSGGFDAAAISQSVHAAMDQIGTDEQRIYDSLRGLTALQGAIVRKMYMARYGSNLDDDLESELSGDELAQAQAQMEGRQAEADAIALHDAVAGLGTDEAAIMRLLRNKTPAEVEAIRAQYFNRYGRTLQSDLEDDLSEGNEIDQANALMAGDTATADAIALDEAMRGGFLGLGTSEEEIEEVQTRVRREVLEHARAENWTSEQMEAEVRRRLGQIEQRFGQRYADVEQYNAPGLEGTVLRRAFASELSREELDLANALQDNDLIAADAARIEIERLSFYTSDEAVNNVLRSQYERALQARRLDEGPARNMRVRRLVEQMAAEGRSLAEIEEARMALERRMENEMSDAAQQDSRLSMDQLRGVYQDRYFWPLDFVVEAYTSGDDRNRARNMLEQGGRLDPLQEVEYATRGVGTDEEVLRRVLGRMTKPELEALREEWERRHPGRSFRAMLENELSGRDRSDIMDMYDHGAPTTMLERIEQERRRVDRELNDLTGVLGGAAAGREADWTRAELARLDEYEANLTRTFPDTEEGRRERARLSDEFDYRVGRVEAAVEDHRRRIDSVTDIATQVVGIVVAVVVATVVTIATAGTAAPAVIAAIAAVSASVAATAATMATKQLIKGGAYGVEEIGVDIGVGVVDALVAAATAGMGSRLLQPLRGLANSTRLPSFAARLGQTGVAQRLAQTQGRGALARIARNIVPTREGVERAMAGFVAQGIEDAVSSVPSALVQIAATDQTWEGNPIKNFLEGGGMAVLQAVAMGRTLGAGMSALHSAGAFGRGLWRGQTDLGRLLELNRLISDGYGAFRQDNPSASIHDFLSSEHGRRVQAEIGQRGLMDDLRRVNQAAETDTPPLAARTQAEENAAIARPGEEPDPARAPQIETPEARAKTLHGTLPEALREGTFVTPDADLNGRTVRVEPLRIGREIVGVDIRVGPDATPLDIALHASTVQAMQRYRGLLGNIRRAWHDLIARATGSGWTIGSRAWEAQMEIAKLPAILHERMERLASGGPLSPEARMRLETDAAALARQFHAHETILADPVASAQPGRGYVAADLGWNKTIVPNAITARVPDADLRGILRLAEEVHQGNRPIEVLNRRLVQIAGQTGLRVEVLRQGLAEGLPHAEMMFRPDASETTARGPRGPKSQLTEAEAQFAEIAAAVDAADPITRAAEFAIETMSRPPVKPKPSAGEEAQAIYQHHKNIHDLQHRVNEALGEMKAILEESPLTASDIAAYREAEARYEALKAELAVLRAQTPPGEAQYPAVSGRHTEAQREVYALRGEEPTEQGLLLEGMAELGHVKQNVEAVRRIREAMADFQPDLVLGVERGGAFMVEIVGEGFRTRIAEKGKKGDRAPDLVAKITQAIADGDRKFVIVDVFMGGGGLGDIRDNVIAEILRAHPGLDDLEFKTLWLREQHGFHKLDPEPVIEQIAPLLPTRNSETGHYDPQAAPATAARMREAAQRGDIALLEFVESLRRESFVVNDTVWGGFLLWMNRTLARLPLPRRASSWGAYLILGLMGRTSMLTRDQLHSLRDILLADPTTHPQLRNGGLKPPSTAKESGPVIEGQNYSHEIIPVTFAVGDDMKMVLEPGTSTDPIVIVDGQNGQAYYLPIGTQHPVTGEPLMTQRQIMAAVLQGYFNYLWSPER